MKPSVLRQLVLSLVFLLIASTKVWAISAPGPLTPLLLQILAAPNPVKGSDGNFHLVYQAGARHAPNTLNDKEDRKIIHSFLYPNRSPN